MPRPVLVAAVLGTALAYMKDDMLNLAIASVARDLDATVSDVQWIVAGAAIALITFPSVGQLAGARGSDLVSFGQHARGGQPGD